MLDIGQRVKQKVRLNLRLHQFKTGFQHLLFQFMALCISLGEFGRSARG